ncbi:MAG: caspase family protein [Rhizobiaceae bacterium]|nr:caspase family protein [Rhizobiaceae bacterium]
MQTIHHLRRTLHGLLAALAACWLLAGATPGIAAAEGKAPDFRLDLDAGGHRGTIKDLVFSPDGQTIASASDDKTIRLWDWQTGAPLKVLRGYQGNDNDGKVFSVAFAPDGKTLAAGGYFGAGLGSDPPYGEVRLFDVSSGTLKAVLPGNEFAVYSVAFSPDGGLLAAAGQDGFVYVWRKDEAAASGWTADRKLDGDSNRIQRIAFAAGGTRIAAVTGDYGIRLWALADGSEIALPADAEPLRDDPVYGLAASHDGSRFATGSAGGLVQIWDAKDGHLIGALPPRPFFVGSLAFAGDRLVVSCGYRCTDRYRSEVWAMGAEAPERSFAGHDGTVFASATSPDGALVATGGGTAHAILVWNPATGDTAATLLGQGLPVMAVGISADGGEIAWGNANPCPQRVACPEAMGALEHRLQLPTAERFFVPPDGLPSDSKPLRARLADGGVSLRAAKGGAAELDNGTLEIVRDGAVVHSIANDATNGAVHAAFTLIDQGRRLITGGNDGTLLEYDTGAAEFVGAFLGGHTNEIHAVAAAEKANLLVTGSADQTIRLWNLETRELIVSMFFAGKEWIAWMPQGYYYASDDGDKLIGWQVNQGRSKEGRFVRAEQLKRYLWSPEMVRRAIILRSAKKAVAEMRPGADKELERLLERRPPEFDVRIASDQSGVRDGFVAVEITGAREAGADVSDFAVLSNSRSIGAFAARSVVGDGDRTVIEVPVEEGENAIRITGTNEFGYLTERSVVALGKKKKSAEKKGKLYAIVIGVEKYPFLQDACNGRSCDLRFPVDDAAEFLRVLASRTAPLYQSMESLVLVNGEALDEEPEAAAAIRAMVGEDGLLEPDSDTIGDEIADFLDRPGPDDTTMLFVAGHGINIDEDYYFIPTDGRRQDSDRWKRSSLVEWSDIQRALERTEGVRLLLMDTCYAANAFNPRIEKDAADARIVVFSATAANNTALEMADLGHGVFTYSLLAGMNGAAKTSKDGVTLFGLADYISREIVELSGSRQKPFYYVAGVDNMLVAAP